MAGSIRAVGERPDVWELRVYLGRDEAGRVRHLNRRFHGSRRAAERELARLVVEQEEKPAPIPEEPARWGPKTTVNDAIAAWRDNGWDDLSPNTAYDYAAVCRLYVLDSIGRRRIASLTPYEVERYLRKLKADGLSKERVRRIRAILNRACRLARRWSGNVLPNPVADTELPSWGLDESSEDVRAPSVAEVRALLETASATDQRLAVFLRLVATTGMRRGEACALRWQDVDFERAKLRIDKSVVVGRNGVSLKSPKTRASIRSIHLDSLTVDTLRQLHGYQCRLAADNGASIDATSFVFSVEPADVDPPRPDSLSRAFGRVRVAARVPEDIHLHSLRHFHATALDAVISEAQKQPRLGWSTVQMARHYTDAVPEEDRRAAEHVALLLAQGQERQSERVRGGASS